MSTLTSLSISIIGGADGPTAVFVSDPYHLLPIFAGIAAVLLAGIVFFLVKKKKK